MTFNKLRYQSAEVKAAQDLATRQALAAMETLRGRKGFDWWFEDLAVPLQNEIFAELRKEIGAVK